MVIKTLTLGALATNCYIVADEATLEAIVIDPADSVGVIENTLKSLNVRLRFVVLTHGHFDHMGAAARLCENGVPLICHEKEAGGLSSPTLNLSGGFGFPEISLYADKTVAEGDEITFGNISLKVIHTPGHTVGGMCLYSKADNVLFSGDTLFSNSIGRSDFPGGDYSLLCQSIREKLYTLPECTNLYPGHGSACTLFEARRDNYYVR